MRVELLTSPGCPNAEQARSVIEHCLGALGIQAPIIDRVGHYPSPTVLVNGVDVMRPDSAPPSGDACRLDLPTHERVRDALRAASARPTG
ncbi:alkylmercury lyase [Mycolicibacterium gadium]|uniref:alkylmercury lyase n=1 Tax=Mycolicibacterium gadium TaxID=1794 RepID=UPI0013D011FE|nr:alkylmercury lyase [Mycolicibacterium gadium]